MRSGLNCGLVLLLAILLSPVTAGADQVILTPVADTALWEREPNDNLGGAMFLPAGTVGSDGSFSRTHLLIRFDLQSALPSGAIIESAFVYLRVVRAPDPEKLSRNTTFLGRRILKDWGEGNKPFVDPQTPMNSTVEATAGEATWGHRFFGDDSTKWAAPGGDYTDNDFAEAGDFDFFTSQFADRDIDRELNSSGIQTLTYWQNNPSQNFGWVVSPAIESQGGTARQFAAREYPEPQYRPRLTIVYSLPQPNPPIITSISHAGTQISIGFDAQAETGYRPQFRPAVNVGPWTELPGVGPRVDDGPLYFFDSVGGVEQRYYRILVE